MSDNNSQELVLEPESTTYPSYTVAKNRSHAVTFRLGEREYKDLLDTVALQGARSLSDYTRAVVMNKVAEALTNRYLEEEICSLSNRLAAFDVALRDLRRHLQEVLNRTNGVNS